MMAISWAACSKTTFFKASKSDKVFVNLVLEKYPGADIY